MAIKYKRYSILITTIALFIGAIFLLSGRSPAIGTNCAPFAEDQLFTIDEDNKLDITLSATDPDRDKLTYRIMTEPDHGRISGLPPNVTYSPYPEYSRADSFTYKVNDGEFDSDIAEVSMTINSVNDPPRIKTIPDIRIPEGEADSSIALDEYVMDIDNSNNELSWRCTGNGNIEVSIDTEHCVTFKPYTYWSGEEVIEFTVTDPEGDSDSQSIKVTVVPSEEVIIYELNLQLGWNFISLPIEPFTKEVTEIFKSIEGLWHSIWTISYNGISREPRFQPDLNSRYSTYWKKAKTMDYGKGYWIYMNEPATLLIKGTAIEKTAIQLYEGWNLVGYNSQTIKTKEEALESIEDIYETGWAYKESDIPEFFEPGKAYWIQVKRSCVWEVSPDRLVIGTIPGMGVGCAPPMGPPGSMTYILRGPILDHCVYDPYYTSEEINWSFTKPLESNLDVKIDADSHEVTYSTEDNCNEQVTFTAVNPDNDTVSGNTRVIIDVFGPSESPLVLNTIHDREIEAGEELCFEVSVVTGKAWISTDSLPDGASLRVLEDGEPSAIEFSWTPQEYQVGEHTVTFTAFDRYYMGWIDSRTITITVTLDITGPDILSFNIAQEITNSSTIEVTGKVDMTDGDTQKVTLTGDIKKPVDIISINADGMFTGEAELTTGDGLKTVTATGYDDLENPGVVTLSDEVELDTDGPDILSLDASPTRTSSTTTISGTVEMLPDLKEVHLTGPIVGPPIIIPLAEITSGSFTKEVTLTSSGEVTATGYDELDNEGKQKSVVVTLDTTGPDILSFNITQEITNSTTVDVTGKVDMTDGDTQKVTLTGDIQSPVDIISINPDGTFEGKAILTSGDGTKTITATAFDDLENAGNSVSDQVELDKTPPSKPVVDPVTSPTNQATQTLSGTKEANTSIWINGIEMISLNSSTSWSVVDVSLNEGQNTFNITAKDRALNESQPAQVNIFLDTTEPTKPVVTDDGMYTASTSELHAAWTSKDAQTGIVEYQYAIGTQPNGTDVVDWTSVGTQTEATCTGLSLTQAQTYYISVKAKNGAGSWSQEGCSDGIKVNQTIPTIVGVQLPDGGCGYTEDSFDFSVDAYDEDEDTLLYQFSVDGQIIEPWQYSHDFSWPTTGVSLGIHTIKVEVSDGNGGEVSEELELCLFRKPILPPL